MERCIRDLPDELRVDLFEGSAPNSLEDNLEWVEQERINLRGEIDGAGFPTIDPVTAPTPHEIGYLTARRVRSELLGLANDVPLPDLTSALERSLGSHARLLTRSMTRSQRAARAFAAELLAPAAALANHVSGRLDDQDVETLAATFLVSSQVIVHQVENHGLGYVDP